MTIRLGVLSTAHPHCHEYVSAVGEIDGADVVAVADEDDERGREFADEHGLEYGSTDEVLERIDAGVVCAANVDHGEWVRAAADAGVDVLCEKPLAPTAAEADELVDVCEDAGVTLAVAMPVRFSEPIRQAKAALEDGAVGELQAIVGTNLLQRMAGGTWFTDPDRSGGGAIMDHSVHVVDLARWLTGQEVTEVYTETGTHFSDIAVEDIDVLSMELADGTIVSHDGSWRQPDSWDFWGDVTMRLIGTEGVLEVDCFDQTFTETRDTGDDPGMESIYWGTDMNEYLVRDFVDAVRDGSEPAIPGEDGVRETRVVEAAYESAETGMPVEIEYELE
ncbi:Gfo/Idh/MocA family oxidoreductase [Natronoglomus mannanivorans]|uniref:Gfo/Idh/MocA family oxidoreductase n=1 Tax=Natronoglomus mannanivorans TaxID=2979990 RepID=A0AAP2Z2M8_9EURY|nr:Gfo/Idh/MocA family oxidoreductase [Halobacteria archaeon AArc-xg1-1]